MTTTATHMSERHQGPLIVIVDDQVTGRKILEQIVRDTCADADVVSFGDPYEALSRIRSDAPDLILTDYKMPTMDGITLIRMVRGIPHCADVPIMVVTIIDERKIRYEALDAGATDFLTRPIDRYECRARCRNLLTLRKQHKIIQDRAKWLEDQVALATQEIQARERETLLRLAKAGEYRDEGTGNHILRIAQYSHLLAVAMGLPQGRCEEIELAAPMHDIGKIGIPDDILRKNGPLTDRERAIMCRHTDIGYEILRGSPSRHIQLGAIVALNHHERYGGGGYPSGISGEDIPLSARIVSVADVYDALTTIRPYKDAWSAQKALEYMQKMSGSCFDPRCITALLRSFDDILATQERLKDPVRTPYRQLGMDCGYSLR